MTPPSPARIVVVGSINVDLVFRTARRPGPGETVVAAELVTTSGGKGANQAVAAAPHAPTHLVGAVGDDASGRDQVAELAASGVGTDLVTVVARPTGTAAIVLTPDGENSILVAAGANDLVDVRAVTQAFAGEAPGIVVAQTEINRSAVDAAARLCALHGARLVLNTAPVVPLDPSTLATADPLVVNEHEAADILRAAGRPVPSAEGLAESVRETTAARAVVVTLGAAGALLSTPGATLHLPAPAVSVRDTTGAGDAFVGTLAGLLAGNPNLPDAVAGAIAAASRVVTVIGARGVDHGRIAAGG